MKPHVLVVDDEPDIRELLQITLEGMDITVDVADSLSVAKTKLSQNNYAMCLTDMRLEDGDGIELVEYIQEHYAEIPTAVITAYGNVEGAVSTLKAGAFDYVSKPINLAILKDLVTTALKSNQDLTDTLSSDILIGESVPIREMADKIHKVSKSHAPVFIYGESGVGKELVAQLIHQNSSRANGPFVPVNCGAIPSELMESEFFGHRKGSFTGAISDHLGLFQAAHKGTLFLDEVAELPMHMQVKLLRAIQEKAIKPVGQTKEVNVDVRILSATHKDLLIEIQANQFRQDLYYRINVIEIKVPPLRNHRDDLPDLVTHILKKFYTSSKAPVLSKDALSALANYSFPGNVRELENILERAVALCDGKAIQADDLQLPAEINNDMTANVSQAFEQPLELALEDQERETILDALEKTKWNRTAAAKLLGISFRALRYRLKKLKIE